MAYILLSSALLCSAVRGLFDCPMSGLAETESLAGASYHVRTLLQTYSNAVSLLRNLVLPWIVILSIGSYALPSLR